ncbi:MAG: MCE family protein [Rhodococcus sp. (in: high G+C Gram-positive bacteria)]
MVARRLAGLAFFLAVIAFVGGSTLIYTKAFDSSVMVDLVTDSVGNALPRSADVKARGVIVGEVRSTTTIDGRVVSRIALNRDAVVAIPSTVTARLLPKTLFGERYVALQIPRAPVTRPIADGDRILQDVSGNAVEVGALLDSVLPLLDAVPPEKLAAALGAVSQALDGRGDMVGRTIDRLETIFSSLGAEVSTIQDDLAGFATLTETYSTAAPDALDALDNLTVTGRTVVERTSDIDTLLASAVSTSSGTANLLADNADSIITFARNIRGTTELLADFSPTFGCWLPAFAELIGDAERILGVNDPFPGARASVNFVNPRGAYLPNQDEPRLFDDRPAACYLDVTAPGEFFPQYPGSGLNDGSYQPPSRNPGPTDIAYSEAPQYAPIPTSYAGSDIERSTLAVVYGEAVGIDPESVPSWTTLVGAPALRGADVSVG